MLDSAGLPPYPPQRNSWQYPPPPVDQRWLWLALGAALVGLVVGATAMTTAIVVGGKDFPALIQDEDVVRVIEQECDLMRETVESLVVQGSVREQVRTLQDQDRAVAIMLDGIRGRVDVRTDRPTEGWLRDWDRLLLAREAYAAGLVDGRPSALRVPRGPDGERITRRMADVWAGGVACEVPPVLLAPYPDDRSEV